MEKKTVENVEIGDRVLARHIGTHPCEWVEGEVVENNAQKCIILKDDGLTVTIFGDTGHYPERNSSGIKVTRV